MIKKGFGMNIKAIKVDRDRLTERLISYCKIDTQSNPDNEDVTPSTEKQFDLARVLVDELNEIGIQDVSLDEHCYVYGKLPGNTDKKCPVVGFLAHMDTAPDFSGTDVKPRVIDNFDGCDIRLNDELTIDMESFPWMKEFKGKRLIVTDGTTLLGADDKAGIACIMEALIYLKEHPEIEHGDITVSFTPDEEIGNGVKCFDVQKFGADFAYTMDGDTVSEISNETFNAMSANIVVKGFSIHPGSAKDKMINAGRIAGEFAAMLPVDMTPEHTENREGFMHLISIEGNCSNAELGYIIRDHDRGKLLEKKALMENAVSYLNGIYGEGVVAAEFRASYSNMYEVLKDKPEITEVAIETIKELGYTPINKPVRGGTDGSGLTFMGVPCPNLGTGGGNFHGPFEYCVIDELEDSMRLVVGIAEKCAKL